MLTRTLSGSIQGQILSPIFIGGVTLDKLSNVQELPIPTPHTNGLTTAFLTGMMVTLMSQFDWAMMQLFYQTPV